MRLEEEESAPRTSGGSGRPVGKKKKQRKKTHNHIGPAMRLYRTGRAFCPVCDAEKILRLTEREKDRERSAREEQKSGRR